MINPGNLQITAHGDREIQMTRAFSAPRKLVFDAYTRPELVRQWLLGPPGWSMPVCEIDLRVGGVYRYLWRRDSDGSEMGVRGSYREIIPSERIVCTERFDQAWYSGESVITTVLAEQSGKTLLTVTMLYESRETRDAVLKSPMESGVAASYNRLEALVAAPPAHGASGT